MSPTRKLPDKEGGSEADPNPGPDDVAVNDAITGPLSQTGRRWMRTIALMIRFLQRSP